MKASRRRMRFVVGALFLLIVGNLAGGIYLIIAHYNHQNMTE